MRLREHEIIEEFQKAGFREYENEDFAEKDLSPHEQAIENIIDEIDLEYGNWFNDAVCPVHSIPISNNCSECKAQANSLEARVRQLGSRYKLDNALFNLANIEYLGNLDDWLTRVEKCWFDNGTAKMYYAENFAEVEKFRKYLDEAELEWSVEKDRRCNNTAFELHQIIDVFLKFRNEHEMDILRGEKVEVANVMY